MGPIARRLLEHILPERLAQLTYDLVSIRSYTGDTVEVATFYARHLASLGMSVEAIADYPNSPVVIARLAGSPGPTLTLNGHLDTVPIAHPPPQIENGIVYGRGAADMKSALAAAAEVVRVVAEGGVKLHGTLQIIAHGLHEAPGGHSEDLTAVLHRGLGGDAAIACEVAEDSLPVVGLGMSIFEITVSREGEPLHELKSPAGTPNPILAAGRVLALLEELSARLQTVDVPRIGPESVFVGIVEGGDFYNRFPNCCRIVGTRRYGPTSSFEDVRAELENLLKPVASATGCSVKLDLQKVKDGFQVAEDEPIVRAVREAYRELNGRELPLSGSRIVADAPTFIREGRIPCVYHGVRGHGAHADLEYVKVDDIVRATRVYLLAALGYLGCDE